jgi:hypothetical protein
MFDFEGFFRERGIPYITDGKNVARGHINIPCPFCGPADPSQHMGIEVASGAWGCWRNALHRGKYPERLLAALLSCTWEEAHALADGFVEHVGLEDLLIRARKLGKKNALRHAPFEELEMDETFKRIERKGLTAPFYEYLKGRGFNDVPDLCKRYKLRCALRGEQRQRLVFPVYSGGKLIAWTGRAIRKAENRYLSYPGNDVIKRVLYNEQNVLGGGLALVIVEGPIDTLKIDFYGQALGVRCVGMLGTARTQGQINRLMELRERFDDLFILLDADAGAQALELQSSLTILSPRVAFLPPGVEDPGVLRASQVRGLLRGMLRAAAA